MLQKTAEFNVWDGYLWLMQPQPEAQSTTRGFLAVSACAFEVLLSTCGTLEMVQLKLYASLCFFKPMLDKCALFLDSNSLSCSWACFPHQAAHHKITYLCLYDAKH